ncbi:MAG TPA: aspartate/glutamate racemase family protein [Noviherbaspirillum sp.]|uniref:aspartate/glutamate racemase family protein n=1 Tax=Noviherbaspirillum sp. TaxID=1926288 RepID=UPI002F93649B
MKTIGMIGGMSWESSAEYYTGISRGMKARLGGHNNGRSILLTLNFEEIKQMQSEGRWQEAGVVMADAARRLQSAGADFVVLCTNTMHKVAQDIEAAIDIPFLHIVTPTAAAISAAGFNRVGLLGTAFTMEQDFYRRRMEDVHGIEVVVPPARERERVHQIIYERLCHGDIRPEDRREYQDIIGGLQAEGAQGVILGCTEITLLVKPEHSSLPVFDTTRLHCEAAVEMALQP